MDRAGALPDRCIVCNDAAGGYRLSRKLYWSPLAWRLPATATPFVVAGIGMATETAILLVLFWPLVLAAMIAHTFVRKKLEIEIGMCGRHRRWRTALRLLSIACIVGVGASTVFWRADSALAAMLLLGSLGGMVLVGVTQAIVGVQAVSVKKLTDEHAWLARTGSAFRAALPELK